MDEVREITEDGEVLANFMYCPTSHQVSRGHVLSGSDRRRGSLRQAIKGPQKETNGWRSHLQEYRPVNKRREINRESNQWTRHYLDHRCFNHIYHCLNHSNSILLNLFLFKWISKLEKPALLLTENQQVKISCISEQSPNNKLQSPWPSLVNLVEFNVSSRLLSSSTNHRTEIPLNRKWRF